jgi:hypothetical protein
MKWLLVHHVPPKTGSNVIGEEHEATELLVALCWAPEVLFLSIAANFLGAFAPLCAPSLGSTRDLRNF